jgi:hypothetical protein
LLEVEVRVDGDAQHLAADAAIEAFDHAIRLRRAGLGVPIGRTELCAAPLEGWREATAVIGQHVSEPEREGCCGFPQEGNGTLRGFIILDRKVHGPGAAVDGNIEVALALFAVSGLQLGQMLDIDVNETVLSQSLNTEVFVAISVQKHTLRQNLRNAE